MPNIDAFSAQIVKLVREMPDEAILALVKNQLGALGVSGARPLGGRRGRPARAPAADAASTRGKRATTGAKRRPGRPRRAVVSEERREMLEGVERIVKSGGGVSASDVAKAAGIPQTRAAAALKELKLAKRIYQGGDRRFARYAGDARVAEQASMTARKTASGPTPVNGKKAARGRKRAQAAATAK